MPRSTTHHTHTRFHTTTHTATVGGASALVNCHGCLRSCFSCLLDRSPYRFTGTVAVRTEMCFSRISPQTSVHADPDTFVFPKSGSQPAVQTPHAHTAQHTHCLLSVLSSVFSVCLRSIRTELSCGLVGETGLASNHWLAAVKLSQRRFNSTG